MGYKNTKITMPEIKIELRTFVDLKIWQDPAMLKKYLNKLSDMCEDKNTKSIDIVIEDFVLVTNDTYEKIRIDYGTINKKMIGYVYVILIITKQTK